MLAPNTEQAIKGKKRKLLNIMLDLASSELPVMEICRQADISTKSFYKYVNDEKFNNELKRLSIQAFTRHLPQTTTAIIKQAKRGNIPASKLMLEALELVGRGTTQTVNVGITQDDKPMEFKNDEERIAYADQVERELVAFRASIGLKRVAVQEGDAIHPKPEGGAHE